MQRVEMRRGRLLEVTLGAPMSAADVTATVDGVRLAVLSSPRPVVIAADVRDLTVLAPEHVDSFLKLLVRGNPRLERSGYLVRHRHSGIGMQMARLIREANHPARQIFESVNEVVAYLDPVLDPEERLRARAYFERSGG